MKELRPLGKFNYAKLNKSMPLDEKIRYMGLYLQSRKIFSTYYIDKCDANDQALKLNIIDNLFGKVLSLKNLTDELTTNNEVEGQIVDLTQVDKGVLAEFVKEDGFFRTKFLYLEKNGLIEMLTLFLSNESCNNFKVLGEDISFLFTEGSYEA